MGQGSPGCWSAGQEWVESLGHLYLTCQRRPKDIAQVLSFPALHGPAIRRSLQIGSLSAYCSPSCLLSPEQSDATCLLTYQG